MLVTGCGMHIYWSATQQIRDERSVLPLLACREEWARWELTGGWEDLVTLVGG